MPPKQNRKIAKACKDLKSLGISAGEVKGALKELLDLYDNDWRFIEDENYRVVLDFIMEKKQGKEKTVKSVSKELRLRDECEDDDEAPLNNLRRRKRNSQVSTFGDDSNPSPVQSPLGKAQEEAELFQTTSRSLSPAEHVRNKRREPDCQILQGEEINHSCSSHKKARPSFVLTREEGKAPVIPRSDTEKIDSNSESEPEIVCIEGPEVESCSKVAATENVMDILDEPGDELLNQPLEEVPLAVEYPDPAVIILPNEDDYSNEKISNLGAEGLGLVETSCPCADDSTSKTSQFDMASSSEGEVKISLICNSLQSDFQFPCLDTVLKTVDDKWLKPYKTTEPFLLMKLMKEICECFLSLGSGSASGGHVGSTTATPTFDNSEKSNAQDVHGGKEDNNFNYSVPSNLPRRSMEDQDVIKLLPPIPKSVGHSGSSDLHLAAGFNVKDLNNFGDNERMELLGIGPQTSGFVEEHSSCYDVVKYGDYVDDITKGEERVKISLLNGFSGADLPKFGYISRNTAYNKACVNFSLSCIPDQDCCPSCFGDCLSSARICACAQEPGGEFVYTPDGLVNEKFLQEYISMNRDIKAHYYFYSEKCPLGSSKERSSSNPCEGHISRKFIRECWVKCGCSKKCGNRVVQRGIIANLQVFLTSKEKGWGLRTLEDLPKGAFICEYVGEVVTTSELRERYNHKIGNEKHTYTVVVLDAAWNSDDVLKDEDALCLDATDLGNVARFINHRCSDANLTAIPVQVESPDRHYYHLAFFTTRKIQAMEELTWDYGINLDDHDRSAFKCLCGSKYCRGSKLSVV